MRHFLTLIQTGIINTAPLIKPLMSMLILQGQKVTRLWYYCRKTCGVIRAYTSLWLLDFRVSRQPSCRYGYWVRSTARIWFLGQRSSCQQYRSYLDTSLLVASFETDGHPVVWTSPCCHGSLSLADLTLFRTSFLDWICGIPGSTQCTGYFLPPIFLPPSKHEPAWGCNNRHLNISTHSCTCI